MSLSFENIPANTRLPFVYAEFSNTNAKKGSSLQNYEVLVMGQRLSTGTKAALTFNKVTSEAQAREYFGAGSQLFTMLKFFFKQNKNASVTAVPVADDGSGVAATGNVLFAGTATDSGKICFYVAGTKYEIAVLEGDTAADVCAALVDEIQSDVDRIVTAAVNGSTDEQMDLTARNKGECGNEIDLRFNYQGQETAAGITHTITSFTSGATNPDIEDVVAALDDTQYNVIISPWTDENNMDALEVELADRWGPERQKEGIVFYCKRDSYADLLTFGGDRNNKHESIIGYNGPTSPWDVAAQVAAEVAKQGPIDPARPIQNLVLNTVLAPSSTERFVDSERNLLLFDGISTLKVEGGKVYIERLITTYQTNAAGADDESYLSVETMLNLSYLRYDFRTGIQLRYPRHKVADDGVKFGNGQPVITPKIGKAYGIAKFEEWEKKGLVENISQFKEDLICERNATNPDRLDWKLSPDLTNQARVFGVQFAFIL